MQRTGATMAGSGGPTWRAPAVSTVWAAIIVAAPALTLLFMLASSRIAPPALSPNGPTLQSAATASLRYGLFSAALQVVLGVGAFAAFWPLRRQLRVLGLGWVAELIEAIILLPYLVPTASWCEAARAVFGPTGPLNGANTGPVLQLYVISALHLFPFSYLAFRLFADALPAAQAPRAGLSLDAVVSAHGRAFAAFAAVLLAFRAAVMAGKYDLPALFGGRTPTNFPDLVTLPVYLYELQTRGSWPLAVASAAAGWIVAASVGVIAAFWVGARVANAVQPAIRPSTRSYPRVRVAVTICMRIVGVSAVLLALGIYGFAAMHNVRHGDFHAVFGWKLAGAFFRTYLYALPVIGCCLIIAFAAAASEQMFVGLAPRTIRAAYMLFYLVPSCAYCLLSFQISLRPRLLIPAEWWHVLWYIAFLVQIGVPIAYFEIRAATPHVSPLAAAMIRSDMRSSLVAFAGLFWRRLAPMASLVAVVILAVIANELYGSNLMLDRWFPINRYLQEVAAGAYGNGEVLLAGAVTALVNSGFCVAILAVGTSTGRS